MLIAPAAEEMERLDRLRAALRRASRAGPRARRFLVEAPREAGEAGARVAAGARPAVAGRLDDAPVNRLVNDRSRDHATGSTQAEVTVAALGDRLVAAWNDGEALATGGDAIGVAWSADGGATWTDIGPPPRGTVVGLWISDPVLTVNARTGTVTLAAMVVSSNARNGIGIAEGRFGTAGFSFDPPVLAREAGRDTLPDKPWIAADTLTGDLALAYTSFFRRDTITQDQIEFQRRGAADAAWSPRLKLSAPGEDGMVQGARPAPGPAGEWVVAWTSIDTTLAGGGVDVMRVRISRDHGASFGPAAATPGHYTNFGSGAPGYNRPYGFTFPGLAVDRSDGPYRGRIYVSWNESVDFYRDALGGGTARVESGSTSDTRSATPAVIGETLRGAIDSPGDVDHFRFAGARGQTVLCYLDSLAATLDLSMRLLCPDGVSRLAYCAPIVTRPRILVFTLPADGEYFLRVAPNTLATGGYRVLTGFHVAGDERARDHRDVFVSVSDDGVNWSTPALVNDDPAGFDDWMPEVAVAPDGRAYAAWYDWRDAGVAPCADVSSIRLARSIDGGLTWLPAGPLADRLTDWSLVSSNSAPNQGDYIALTADASALRAAWADGRGGDPDVYFASRDLAGDPVPGPIARAPVISRALPNPTRGELVIEFSVPDGDPAVLELVDLAGRRWRRLVLDHPERGTNRADLGAGPRLPAGLYFLRVSQAGRSAAARVVVVR